MCNNCNGLKVLKVILYSEGYFLWVIHVMQEIENETINVITSGIVDNLQWLLCVYCIISSRHTILITLACIRGSLESNQVCSQCYASEGNIVV